MKKLLSMLAAVMATLLCAAAAHAADDALRLGIDVTLLPMSGALVANSTLSR